MSTPIPKKRRDHSSYQVPQERKIPRKRHIDHIFILRNIIEQRTERQRQLKINFLDFEKAFHSMYLESLWRIVQAYGMLQQIIDIIESFYANFTCRVGGSETSFLVKSGVRRGCTMSEMLST